MVPQLYCHTHERLMPMRLDDDGNLYCERCGLHLGYWFPVSQIAHVFGRETVKRLNKKGKR